MTIASEYAAPTWAEHLLVAYARHFPLRRGKLRLVNALWRSVSSRRGSSRLARLNHGGYAMPCDLRDMLQRQFYFFGTYFLEDRILRAWSEAASTARIVFDVGANAGIYSLAALAANPAAVVHAFEPTPEIGRRLRATASLNHLAQIQVHELAVFSHDTDLALQRWRGDTGDNEGMNFVSEVSGASGAEIVRGVSLDRFCADNGIDTIDLMKIDIQGQEPAALRGAQRLLADGRIGVVFLELNWADGAAAACPGTEAVELLSAAGYWFSIPDAPHTLRPAGDWMRSLSDVVARRPSGDKRGRA